MSRKIPYKDIMNHIKDDVDYIADEAYQNGYEDGAKSVQNWDEEEKNLRIKEAYQKGLDDAWECAKKINCLPRDGGLSGIELDDIFNMDSNCTIMKEFSASEAMEKIKEYEEEQEEKKSQIKVGDEVIHKDGTKAVILDEELLENCWKVITENRTVEPWHKTLLKKTGRHFGEIETLLEKMRGEE